MGQPAGGRSAAESPGLSEHPLEKLSVPDPAVCVMWENDVCYQHPAVCKRLCCRPIGRNSVPVAGPGVTSQPIVTVIEWNFCSFGWRHCCSAGDCRLNPDEGL